MSFIIIFNKKRNWRIAALSISFSILFLMSMNLSARSASTLVSIQPIAVNRYANSLNSVVINISPNGEYFSVITKESVDSTYDLKIYRTPNGSEPELTSLWNMSTEFLAINGFSAKGNKMLYTSYIKNTTRMYTLPSSTPDWTKTFTQPLCDRDLSLNEDGSLVVIRTYETGKQGVLLLNGSNGETIWRREYPPSSVYGLRITYKNNVFVSVNTFSEKRIEKIDVNNQTLWNKTYDYAVYQMEIARNESRMVCTDYLSNITFIDPNSGDVLHHKYFTESVGDVVVSEDGSRVVVALKSGGSIGKFLSISPSTYEIIKEATNFPRGYVIPLDEHLDNFLIHSDGYSNAFIVMDTESMAVKFNRTLSLNNELNEADSSLTSGIFGILLSNGYLYMFSSTKNIVVPAPSFLEELIALFTKPINWVGLGLMAFFGVILGFLIGKKRK